MLLAYFLATACSWPQPGHGHSSCVQPLPGFWPHCLATATSWPQPVPGHSLFMATARAHSLCQASGHTAWPQPPPGRSLFLARARAHTLCEHFHALALAWPHSPAALGSSCWPVAMAPALATALGHSAWPQLRTDSASSSMQLSAHILASRGFSSSIVAKYRMPSGGAMWV